MAFNDTLSDSSYLFNPYDADNLTYFATKGVAPNTPEPETYGMMLAGLRPIGVAVRRRRGAVTRRG
ncbi:MAG: PEP-CTERM sorting domain-containing protein [Bryobacteraceae bacterium]